MTDKKVCLLTGAGGTLGAEFCRRYASKYAIAAVCGRRPVPWMPDQNHRMIDPLDPQAAIPENQSPIFTIHADLTKPSDLERITALALARFGRIDVVVNAAVYWLFGSTIENDAVLNSAEGQFLVNVVTPLRLATVVARAYWRDRVPENRAQNRSVVNISSTSGVHIYGGTGQGIYSASKAALNYLTCHMAEEFWRVGVRVTGIAPTSFPGLLATATVADALDRAIETGPAGKMMVLEQDREYLIPA
jgi:NAD(P)-dependent dehydrogenase (short-subunit alcohol dehydrogenase family)